MLSLLHPCGSDVVSLRQDEAEAAQQRAEGYALYEEKPNLRRRDRRQIGTWSDEEYAHVAILFLLSLFVDVACHCDVCGVFS